MSKHTPGPWSRADEKPTRPYYVAQVCHAHLPWAYVAAGEPTGGSGWPALDEDNIDEMKANAQLIAAAPDLLKACQTALDLLCASCRAWRKGACDAICEDRESHNILQDAIQKATEACARGEG